MAEQQQLLSTEFEGVRTYIQSGNIVLTSDKSRLAIIGDKIYMFLPKDASRT